MQIYQGYGRRVRVDDAGWIYLEPIGLMPGLRRAKSIPLQSVVGVHLSDASLFRNGFLQLILSDDPVPPLNGTGPNSLMFLRQHNERFAVLRDWLGHVATINLARSAPTVAPPAPKSEPSVTDPTKAPFIPATPTQPTKYEKPWSSPRLAPQTALDAPPPPPPATEFPSLALAETTPRATRRVPIAPEQASPPVVDGVDRSDEGLLASLLSEGDRIAVVDVETTGVYNNDRVVEVAVVTINRHGEVVDEFDSLVNPLRDPGPTWLHGLTPETLQHAPTFEDIAFHLAALLDGAVVAAHNLPFDRRLLTREFDRIGINVDWGEGLDTLYAAGGRKLALACSDFGVDLRDAHRALGDARATAHLVLKVAGEFRSCRPSTAVPTSSDVPRVLTRDGLTQADIERPYLLELARGLQVAPDIAAYVGLLDYAVADLKLDPQERIELASLAKDLGLTQQDRVRAHRQFLNGLLDAAIDDGIVGRPELDHLCRTAALLEIDDLVVRSRLDPLLQTTETLDLCAGMTVCFTGAAETLTGTPVQREDLVFFTRRYALEPVDSVTKSTCQLLVAADPSTMSRKAKDARRFGIPIASAADFQAALTGQAPLKVARVPASTVGLVCTGCGDSWMAARRQTSPVCVGCREAAKPSRGTESYLPGHEGLREDGRGRNDANTAQRTVRLDRCKRAVELQRDGASRGEISLQLGVSVDTVKALLRDGKFYEAPEQDVARLNLASRAAVARVNGLTRAAFAEQSSLSKGRAEECWRDSDVLFDENGQPHSTDREM